MALFSIKSFFNVRISPEGNYKTIGEGDDVEQALSYVPYQHHVQCWFLFEAQSLNF